VQLPYYIRVGSKNYHIVPVPHLGGHLGYIDYNDKTILVATCHPKTGKLRTERQQAYSFWHEVTHAILKDMGHKLEANEEFVDAFAIRLNDAIHNAKL